MADRVNVLIIDAPGWTDRETLKMATVDLLRDPLTGEPHGRSFGNGAASACAENPGHRGVAFWRGAERAESSFCRAGRPRRSRLSHRTGYTALPGFVRDLKPYEIALLEGKAITETGEKALNDEAFVLVNGIAGAVLEAGKRLTREALERAQANRDAGHDRDKGGRGR